LSQRGLVGALLKRSVSFLTRLVDGCVGSRPVLDVSEKRKIAYPCRDSNNTLIQSRLNSLGETGGRTGRQYCEGKVGKQENRVLHFTELKGKSIITSDRTRRHQSVPKRRRSPLCRIPEDYNMQQLGCENHRSNSVVGFEFRRSPSQKMTCSSGPSSQDFYTYGVTILETRCSTFFPLCCFAANCIWSFVY
jgi:hypothetical protein